MQSSSIRFYTANIGLRVQNISDSLQSLQSSTYGGRTNTSSQKGAYENPGRTPNTGGFMKRQWSRPTSFKGSYEVTAQLMGDDGLVLGNVDRISVT